MEPSKKLELVERNPLKSGQKKISRLKARHLSTLTKQIILQKFAAYESYDDVIREMDIPGLTRSCVSEVLHSIQVRKGPAVAERSIAMFRQDRGVA